MQGDECEDWWNNEILPQIEKWINPSAMPFTSFPSNKMKDYVQKDVSFDKYIGMEIKAIMRQMKTIHDKLPENEPVPVWCDDNKTVMTVRGRFMDELFDALGSLYEIEAVSSSLDNV